MPAPAATTCRPARPSGPGNGAAGIFRLLDDPPAAACRLCRAGAATWAVSGLAVDRPGAAAAAGPAGMLRAASGRICRAEQRVSPATSRWRCIGAMPGRRSARCCRRRAARPGADRSARLKRRTNSRSLSQACARATRDSRPACSPPGIRSNTARRCGRFTPQCAERHPRHRRRRAFAARTARPGTAERLRRAGHEPAVPVRGRRRRGPGCAARSARPARSGPGFFRRTVGR